MSHPGLASAFPQGYYDLGLAHGLGGVLAFLAEAWGSGFDPIRSRSLLDGGVAWLLDQRGPGDDWWSLPQLAGPGVNRHPSRLGWCSGELSLAGVLFRAGRLTRTPHWEEAGLGIARACTRRSLDQARAPEPGFCLGAAGIAHTFNRLFHATGDPAFKEAALTWFERALAMRQPGIAFGGYARHTPEGPQEDPSLLRGGAGVGLALLSALTPVVPGWDAFSKLSFNLPASPTA
jgi:hypothetical protein